MTTPRITLRQIQIFRAVADTGSTAAAATQVSLSQSATSTALVELERALGIPLFDRIGRRLLLNDNGRALLPKALFLLDAGADIEQWAADENAQIGTLRIGASTTIGNYLLPRLLADFRRSLELPEGRDWNVRVAIANTEHIVQQVTEFELDLGLIEGPCLHKGLHVSPWITDDMVIVAAADDPQWSGLSRRVTLKDLKKATWLLREPGSGTREIVSQLLIPHLHQLRTGIEFGTSEAIKRAVSAGLGISCLSRVVVEDMLKSGALVEVLAPLPRLTRQFYRITDPRKPITRGLGRLCAFLAGMAPQA